MSDRPLLARLLVVLLVVSFVAAACDEPTAPDAGPADGGAIDAAADAATGPRCEDGLDAGSQAAGITRGCAQGAVASGFGIRLDGPAMPLARWGAHLRLEAPDICRPGIVLSAVTLVTDVDRRAPGGLARATYSVLGESSLSGEVDAGTAAPVRVERGRVTLEPSADAEVVSAPALFDLAAVGFDAAGAIAVVLDGIEIDTDIPQDPSYPPAYDPADGYAVHAIGASVGDVVIDGTDLRFTVGARLALGRSGETDMDRAAAVARSQVIVRYAVVALPAAPATGSVGYDVTCRPGADVGGIALDAPAGSRAVPALTAFSIELDEAVDGAFVRELAVLLQGFAIDASGHATMRLEAFLEGADAAMLPQHVEADVALLAWRDADDVEALGYAAAVGNAVSETPLPIAR
ncbi:MAG: hypothetical protein KC619_21050 [Myxococcales bacterium]|nr:hypothetical protein [Myxococcales bacterium]